MMPMPMPYLLPPLLLALVFARPLAAQVSLSESHLPVVVIQTIPPGEIPDEPKIPAHMGIVWHPDGSPNSPAGPFDAYDGWVGIEIRGSSSQSFPKKNYAVETREADGSARNVSLLGLPAENDWILHGPFSDKSLLRNAITYVLAGQLMAYAPRVRFCEVLINGDYKGVYLLTEKIKRDRNRVDISNLKPEDNSGDELTGGYILKFDKWDGAHSEGFQSQFRPYPGAAEGVYYQYHEPAPDEITDAQREYIRAFVHQMEFVLQGPDFADPERGYPAYFDLDALVHYFFLQELGRNVDGYRLSTFLSKDKDSVSPLFKAGPVWDFNLAYGNVDYCTGPSPAGWAVHFNDVCPSDAWSVQFWWRKIFEEPAFRYRLCSRWQALRAADGRLSDTRVTGLVDSLATLLGPAAQRNFERWPVLGTYVWPNSFVGGTYAAELDFLRQWLSQRLAWMDREWADCRAPVPPVPAEPAELVVLPNPAAARVVFRIPAEVSEPLVIDIFDVLGRPLERLSAPAAVAAREVVWDQPAAPGVYLYRIGVAGRTRWEGRLVRLGG
ncbi:MAG: hypothetical protein RLY31_174 [Bacteroidota bacterium]